MRQHWLPEEERILKDSLAEVLPEGVELTLTFIPAIGIPEEGPVEGGEYKFVFSKVINEKLFSKAQRAISETGYFNITGYEHKRNDEGFLISIKETTKGPFGEIISMEERSDISYNGGTQVTGYRERRQEGMTKVYFRNVGNITYDEDGRITGYDTTKGEGNVIVTRDTAGAETVEDPSALGSQFASFTAAAAGLSMIFRYDGISAWWLV